jgi:hypothetical protein
MVRSRIRSRSNSASDPKRWNTSFPPDVVVSMFSVSDRKPILRSASALTVSMRWRRDRPSRSSRQTCWVIDVNLWGVIDGSRVFLPIMKSQGAPGHRQHRVYGRFELRPSDGSVFRIEVRRGRVVRIDVARSANGRRSDRRVGVVPGLCEDANSRGRPQPPSGTFVGLGRLGSATPEMDSFRGWVRASSRGVKLPTLPNSWSLQFARIDFGYCPTAKSPTQPFELAPGRSSRAPHRFPCAPGSGGEQPLRSLYVGTERVGHPLEFTSHVGGDVGVFQMLG